MRTKETDADEKLFPEMQRRQDSQMKGSKREPFAMVPLWWARAASKATRTSRAFVWVWLVHLAWKAKSLTFAVPNGQLERYGISRYTKGRTLRDLELAGLIMIERRIRKTPIVTLLCL